ncbi:MAG: GH39 family glycosyl hydrolase [Promethearchaeota archaeon]
MKEIKLKVNIDKIIDELEPFWRKVVGCGHAYLLTRKDLLDHIEEAHEVLGFEFIRFHGILSDDVGLVQFADTEENEIDPDCLNFNNVDTIFDNLLDIGIKPFVELSFMPKYLASGRDEVFHYPSITNPPANYELWESLIYRLVLHWKDRYGLDEVRQWYFEVWNEPNLKSFWRGTMQDYFKLYLHAANAIKSVDQKLRVGGPASADGKWIVEFLEFCRSADAPVDFISTHAYPTDEPLHGSENRIIGDNYIKNLLQDVNNMVKKSPYNDREIHITEWNSSTSPLSLIHDGSNNAAFICNTVLSVNHLVKSFSYWTVSDIFEEIGFPDRAFHGGFGLFNIHGIRKPSFHAFYLLNKLGSKLCETLPDGHHEGIGFQGAVSEDSIQLLSWYYVKPKQTGANPVQLNISINKSGMFENKSLDFEIWEVNVDHSNSYEAWRSIGAPRNPTPDQIEDLKQMGELEKCRHDNIAYQSESEIGIKTILTPASILFVKFFPEEDFKKRSSI